MNIFLTFDYELFFGTHTGSVEKCMLNPTNDLLRLAKDYQIPMTFFVDVGFLLALEREKSKDNSLELELVAIKNQLQMMEALNCSVQLHIHPHWEKSYFEDGKWIIKTEKAYKLSDFSTNEQEEIIERYKTYLDNCIQRKTNSFRAGGWCIQPFSELKTIFKKLQIQIDSSVFKNGMFHSEAYNFDFRNAPDKCRYSFEEDVCQEVKSGYFTELPISSYLYHPFFYWRLYGWGRLFPRRHKMLGDGQFLAQPGRKKSVLTHRVWNHVSSDGYYASMLNRILKSKIKKGDSNFVVIGHPKGNTLFSVQQLESFIAKNHKIHQFLSFNDLRCE
jgi:hypothetical protein